MEKKFYLYGKGNTTVNQKGALSYLRWLHLNISRFDMTCAHNDIGVLQRSVVFSRLAKGNAPTVNHQINGEHYDKGYYLSDSIYPRWSTFVRTICNPKDEKESGFAKKQEDARKDVQKTLGVLQSRWAILRHFGRTWSKETMWEIMSDP
jgi:hypothetical protein